MKDKYGNQVKLTGRYETDYAGRAMAEVEYADNSKPSETESYLVKLLALPVRKAGDIVKKFVYPHEVED